MIVKRMSNKLDDDEDEFHYTFKPTLSANLSRPISGIYDFNIEEVDEAARTITVDPADSLLGWLRPYGEYNLVITPINYEDRYEVAAKRLEFVGYPSYENIFKIERVTKVRRDGVWTTL